MDRDYGMLCRKIKSKRDGELWTFRKHIVGELPERRTPYIYLLLFSYSPQENASRFQIFRRDASCTSTLCPFFS